MEQQENGWLIVHSDEAKRFTTRCPECNRRAKGTGKLSFERRTGSWWIEYRCPVHQNLSIYSPETQARAQAITKKVLGDRYPQGD
jgi:hypothetical protein